MNTSINWDIIFINTLSQEANLFINKKILAKYGLDLAVFISFLVNQYNYFLTNNQLTEDKMFFATDDDIFLFTNMPRTRITSIKKQAQQLGIISIKKLGQPIKTYYKVNFEFLVSVLSSTESIKELAYNRALSDEDLTEDYIRTLTYRELRLLCKKLEISYTNLSTKEDYINKILEVKQIKSSESTNNSDSIPCADKSHTNKNSSVCGKTANACAEKLPTRVQNFCTKHNINQAKTKSTKNKNHDIDDELDFFENLFKELGVNFTKTNKESVLRIRKRLSLKDTELYLRETYSAIIENKDVKNVEALFSAKIKKGERQINSKNNKEYTEKNDTIENPIEIDYMEIFEKLDTYDKLKIEEEAIELLIKEQQIEVTFIFKTKEAQPTIYKGMIKSYIERAMKAQNYV
ncbi:Uncharacterised protein [Fusobacterium necrogenes]|uniref:Replication initiator protein A (RepA) N-terminus n=1 Tax=Fusobacterium necrogenes TaxID=858 RepID=A0A377GP97_9FUSO|nr:hypothetical protein [Fusobacterium necrogenes]STO26841.1 Uncharacterised protein [Fusobacterium necrogenes]